MKCSLICWLGLGACGASALYGEETSDIDSGKRVDHASTVRNHENSDGVQKPDQVKVVPSLLRVRHRLTSEQIIKDLDSIKNVQDWVYQQMELPGNQDDWKFQMEYSILFHLLDRVKKDYQRNRNQGFIHFWYGEAYLRYSGNYQPDPYNAIFEDPTSLGELNTEIGRIAISAISNPDNQNSEKIHQLGDLVSRWIHWKWLVQKYGWRSGLTELRLVESAYHAHFEASEPDILDTSVLRMPTTRSRAKRIATLQRIMENLNSSGIYSTRYDFALAQAWIDYAHDEYSMHNRSATVNAAIDNAENTIMHSILGKSPASKLEREQTFDLDQTQSWLSESRFQTLAKVIDQADQFKNSMDQGYLMAELEVLMERIKYQRRSLGSRHSRPLESRAWKHILKMYAVLSTRDQASLSQ